MDGLVEEVMIRRGLLPYARVLFGLEPDTPDSEVSRAIKALIRAYLKLGLVMLGPHGHWIDPHPLLAGYVDLQVLPAEERLGLQASGEYAPGQRKVICVELDRSEPGLTRVEAVSAALPTKVEALDPDSCSWSCETGDGTEMVLWGFVRLWGLPDQPRLRRHELVAIRPFGTDELWRAELYEIYDAGELYPAPADGVFVANVLFAPEYRPPLFVNLGNGYVQLLEPAAIPAVTAPAQFEDPQAVFAWGVTQLPISDELAALGGTPRSWLLPAAGSSADE
jgi:hypothetical protein